MMTRYSGVWGEIYDRHKMINDIVLLLETVSRRGSVSTDMHSRAM